MTTRVAELSLDRYKYVVQVFIGEQRGEGVWYVMINESGFKRNNNTNRNEDEECCSRRSRIDVYRLGGRYSFWFLMESDSLKIRR